MAPKNANGFRRSLSFQNHSSSKPPQALHSRSTSLPCRSLLTVSHLIAGISHLHSWIGSGPTSWGSAYLCDGMKLLNSVHDSLVDLLQLPRTRNLLGRGGELSILIVERLLEDFLSLIDVYGRFQVLVLMLKDECSAAEMAVRKRDCPSFDSHLKNLNKHGIEIGKLSSDLCCRAGSGFSVPALHDDESEIVKTMEEALQVTSLVSVCLFDGISASFAIRKRFYMGLIRFGRWAKTWKIEVGIWEIGEIDLDNLWGLRKKADQDVRSLSKKLHELEGCIAEMEGFGERTFRSLINTRVSLLNLLTLQRSCVKKGLYDQQSGNCRVLG